ncbi:unnamed protein product, partial [Ectocarpus sp. 8 AP-2014]
MEGGGGDKQTTAEARCRQEAAIWTERGAQVQTRAESLEATEIRISLKLSTRTRRGDGKLERKRTGRVAGPHQIDALEESVEIRQRAKYDIVKQRTPIIGHFYHHNRSKQQLTFLSLLLLDDNTLTSTTCRSRKVKS